MLLLYVIGPAKTCLAAHHICGITAGLNLVVHDIDLLQLI